MKTYVLLTWLSLFGYLQGFASGGGGHNGGLEISIGNLNSRTIPKMRLVSLLLDVSDSTMTENDLPVERIMEVADGKAVIKVDELKNPMEAVLSLFDAKKGLLHAEGIFVLPSDVVSMTVNGDLVQFSGKLAQVFIAQHAINTLLNYNHIKDPVPDSEIARFYTILDRIADSCNWILSQNRRIFGEDRYWLLRANVIWKIQQRKEFFLEAQRRDIAPRRADVLFYLGDYKDKTLNSGILQQFRNVTILKTSIRYLALLRVQYYLDSCFSRNRDFDPVMACTYFERKSTGIEREWVIYGLVRDHYLRNDDLKTCISDAVSKGYLQHRNIKDFFNDLLQYRMSGAQAYNFSLLDTGDSRVSLTNMRGNVVLLDFWYKGCGPCVDLHPILDSVTQSIIDKKFKFISICVDYQGQSRDDWRDIIKSDKYTSETHQNLIAHIRNSADSLTIIARYKVLACPTIMLIDKNGIIGRLPLDPREDKGADLVKRIKEELARRE